MILAEDDYRKRFIRQPPRGGPRHRGNPSSCCADSVKTNPRSAAAGTAPPPDRLGRLLRMCSYRYQQERRLVGEGDGRVAAPLSPSAPFPFLSGPTVGRKRGKRNWGLARGGNPGGHRDIRRPEPGSQRRGRSACAAYPKLGFRRKGPAEAGPWCTG